MRQINFVVFFVLALALVLFSIQNSDPVIIHVIRGIDVEAPLCVDLLVAMGTGAVLAWVLSVWFKIQSFFGPEKKIAQREVHIQKLEKEVERYRFELEQQPKLMASQDSSESDPDKVFAS